MYPRKYLLYTLMQVKVSLLTHYPDVPNVSER